MHRSCFYNFLVCSYSNVFTWCEMTLHMSCRCHKYNIFAQLRSRVSAATSLITAAVTQGIDFLGQGSRSTAFELKRHYFFFPRIQSLPVFLIRECCWPAIRESTRRKRERALSRDPRPARCCLIHLQSSASQTQLCHMIQTTLEIALVCLWATLEGCGG